MMGMGMNPMLGMNIIDIGINSIITALMTGQKIEINKKTIMYIILFASLGELKELIKNLFIKIKQLSFIDLQNIFSIVQETFSSIIKAIFDKIMPKRTLNRQNDNAVSNGYGVEHTTLRLGLNHNIIDAIISYIHDLPHNGSYSYEIINSNVINLKTRQDTIYIYNIIIMINKIKVIITTNFVVVYEITENSRHIINVYMQQEQIPTQLKQSHNKSFLSLGYIINNNLIIKILEDNKKCIEKLIPIISENYKGHNNGHIIRQAQKDVHASYIINTIFYIYPKLHNTKNLWEYLLTELLILLYYEDYNIRFTQNHIHFNKLKFSIELTHDSSNFDMTNCSVNPNNIPNYKSYVEKLLFKPEMMPITQTFDSLLLMTNNTSLHNSTNDIILSIKIHQGTDSLAHTPSLVSIWNSFLQNEIIQQYAKKQFSVENVTVYILKIKETINESEIPNPEYNSYNQKKALYDSLSQQSNVENASNPQIMIDMGLHIIPPKTITKQTSIWSIHCSEEGSVKKRLDTLYLRKQDFIKLATILHMFKENSSVYDDLCINKKLGIMLHGDPGTGKSSTIMAIATYLNYDIYYVSLNGVKTNSQLDIIFDHVMENCSKNGMIVFEDIDAQTDIVHRRGGTRGIDEGAMLMHDLDSKKDDDLDLSYFLNKLDGTLAKQNMVYVMTTNHLEKLDPALIRKGRINAIFHLKKCDRYQVSHIFEKIMGRKIDEEVLGRIEEDKFVPAQIIFHLLEMVNCVGISDEEMMEEFCL